MQVQLYSHARYSVAYDNLFWSKFFQARLTLPLTCHVKLRTKNHIAPLLYGCKLMTKL